ncbi:hypothetical protein GOBAR_AA15748 [Gossypium barbadense]|uniref:Peptidase S54 rhomboid domain-containing protein n=1 Tax=Gossypium barbadense TaxID=3634 RepID=A0A2P5XNK4_GOSBA|nr:hypothetical protein GOBAR_AA15748 [Gossypium barbadense]
MGKPLFYEILEKPATSCIIGICSGIWFYIQKKNIGYQHVGLSYETAIEGHHWRVTSSAFSHISVLHLVFNMSALWSLGVIEQLDHLGLGVANYLHYTLVLVVVSGLLVLGMYHFLIQRFKIEYFRRVTAVGYSCVVFGWMTILSVKQPSSKLNLFGFLSLPISFAPFESLIFTSIIVPQASFLGHLSGIIVGYAIAWGLIHGMTNYWAVSTLGWIAMNTVPVEDKKVNLMMLSQSNVLKKNQGMHDLEPSVAEESDKLSLEEELIKSIKKSKNLFLRMIWTRPNRSLFWNLLMMGIVSITLARGEKSRMRQWVNTSFLRDNSSKGVDSNLVLPNISSNGISTLPMQNPIAVGIPKVTPPLAVETNSPAAVVNSDGGTWTIVPRKKQLPSVTLLPAANAASFSSVSTAAERVNAAPTERQTPPTNGSSMLKKRNKSQKVFVKTPKPVKEIYSSKAPSDMNILLSWLLKAPIP